MLPRCTTPLPGSRTGSRNQSDHENPLLSLGIISDTHGLLRPDAVDALRGCDLILHAGDIGRPVVIEDLSRICPVRCVRGNVDLGSWAQDLPRQLSIQFEDVRLLLVHDLAEAGALAETDVVVFGHSHRPLIKYEKVGEPGGERTVLFFNPGSAGPRRFSLPVSVGRMSIDGSTVAPSIVSLS
jgi:uncharacterized protein